VEKRVLIIAHSYYPSTRAGAHRPSKWAKYLPKFGWEPVVLCPDWTPENSRGCYDPMLAGRDVCKTIRAPYRVPSKNSPRGILYRFGGHYLPAVFPWQLYRAMRARAFDLVERESFAAVVASAPPAMMHTIASAITRKHGIPALMDFRDLPDELAEKYPFSSRVKVRSEVAACRNAGALVTVSEFLAEKLRSRHRVPVFVIPNGFDPADFSASTERDQHFTIVYAGIIHADRNPAPLLDALDGILRSKQADLSKLRLRFYGPPEEQILRFVNDRPCSALVEAMGRVPFSECLRAEQRATVLLLLSHSRSKGIMTAKVFEYLGAGRPILSVPGDHDCTDALLEHTRAGVVGRTVDEIQSVILEWYDTWLQTGRVPYAPVPEAVAEYTRERQTEQLANVLDRIAR